MLVALLFGFVFAFTDMIVICVLTRGGPYDSTQVLASLAFFKGSTAAIWRAALAIALFLLPVLAAAAILMLRLARRTEVVVDGDDARAAARRRRGWSARSGSLARPLAFVASRRSRSSGC